MAARIRKITKKSNLGDDAMPAMNRYRAAATHFGLSALVVGAVFVLVYFLWYPGPLFEGAGGRDLFVILALVDVTVGPLITLVIFKPGKKGLKFDLAVIAMVQVAALSYGTYAVHQARPAWVVFLIDRFDMVRANQVVEASRRKAAPEFQGLSLTGPKLVGARVPDNAEERLETMLSAAGGVDVSSYPQHFVRYADIRAEVAAQAKPIKDLRKLNPGAETVIQRALARHGREESTVGFLPLRADKRELAVLVDAKTGEYLGMVDLVPW
jgi:hypothetical protein